MWVAIVFCLLWGIRLHLKYVLISRVCLHPLELLHLTMAFIVFLSPVPCNLMPLMRWTSLGAVGNLDIPSPAWPPHSGTQGVNAAEAFCFHPMWIWATLVLLLVRDGNKALVSRSVAVSGAAETLETFLEEIPQWALKLQWGCCSAEFATVYLPQRSPSGVL